MMTMIRMRKIRTLVIFILALSGTSTACLLIWNRFHYIDFIPMHGKVITVELEFRSKYYAIRAFPFSEVRSDIAKDVPKILAPVIIKVPVDDLTGANIAKGYSNAKCSIIVDLFRVHCVYEDGFRRSFRVEESMVRKGFIEQYCTAAFVVVNSRDGYFNDALRDVVSSHVGIFISAVDKRREELYREYWERISPEYQKYMDHETLRFQRLEDRSAYDD